MRTESAGALSAVHQEVTVEIEVGIEEEIEEGIGEETVINFYLLLFKKI
jgi:hypothetical protein